MIKYFVKAFKMTNENIILTTPLVLFLLLFFIYIGVVQNAPSTFAVQILSMTTVLFMFSAFFAGWLYMTKCAVDLDKITFETVEEKAKGTFGLLKKIPTGIGEYFFSFLGAIILYTFLLALVYLGVYKAGMHFIGDVGIGVKELNSALSTFAGTEKLLSTLSHAQLAKASSWVMLFFGSIMLFYFMTMFWFIHIILKSKNPLKAFFESIGMIFKNFPESIILFVYISLINFATTLISSVLGANSITQFVSMLISFYFVVYVVVLVFLYYDDAINRKLETKVVESGDSFRREDAETQDNSGSGSDSVGEEQSGDSDSKES